MVNPPKVQASQVLLMSSWPAADTLSGAKTAAVTCNHNTPMAGVADITIVADVGPEAISGSTRMKAATAQKMVLNMITTGAMTRLGYVYDNLMVNVQPSNVKLANRARRIVAAAADVGPEEAARLLEASGGAVKTAIVMARRKLGRAEADDLVRRANGRISVALGL